MKSNYASTVERLMRQAAAEQLVLSVAKPNEIFIDLDDTLNTDAVVQRIRQIHSLFGPVERAYARHSKSGAGLHVRVVMRDALDPRERCILGLVCGSDQMRELLRLRAIKQDTDDQPSVFLDHPSHGEWELSLPGVNAAMAGHLPENL